MATALALEFTRMMTLARDQSIAEGCTRHVHAQLHNGPEEGTEYGCPRVVGFYLSDWYDPSCVASWTKGLRD